MLIGIVVKNAIVLVDFINLTRDRGVELYQAVLIQVVPGSGLCL
jgi:hydrophobic/amphiphilic exporter-1 (mainly G- bacteria), HAE1 family